MVCFHPKVLLLRSTSRSELRWVVETKNLARFFNYTPQEILKLVAGPT